MFDIISECDSLSVTIIWKMKVELMLVCVSHAMVLLILYKDCNSIRCNYIWR